MTRSDFHRHASLKRNALWRGVMRRDFAKEIQVLSSTEIEKLSCRRSDSRLNRAAAASFCNSTFPEIADHLADEPDRDSQCACATGAACLHGLWRCPPRLCRRPHGLCRRLHGLCGRLYLHPHGLCSRSGWRNRDKARQAQPSYPAR